MNGQMIDIPQYYEDELATLLAGLNEAQAHAVSSMVNRTVKAAQRLGFVAGWEACAAGQPRTLDPDAIVEP